MSADAVPTTLVLEIMVPIQETLRLEAQDGPREVMDKGLYSDSAPDKQPVVVYDGDAVFAVASRDDLRDSILPMTWWAPLRENLGGVGRPPEVTAQTRAVDLSFLVKKNHKIDWLAVVDAKTHVLVGVLDRRQVPEYRPPSDPDPTEPTKRIWRLHGVAGVQNVYYYCEVEKRIYGPNAVDPEANGQMRDRHGHPVEVVEPPGR